MKPEPKIALDEWLAELVRLSDHSDEGLTSSEWAVEMRLSKDHALRRLKRVQDAGWLKAGRRRVTALDGRSCTVPVYQIVKPKSGTNVPKGGTR